MKIFSASQIRAIDAYTIKHEPILSIDLMERASSAFVDWFTKLHGRNKHIQIFCGLGNNGGDGLAIGRILIEKGFSVEAFVCLTSKNSSHEFSINKDRLQELTEIRTITKEVEFPRITSGIVIDALFGSGLTRQISGLTASLIEKINQSDASIISVDIASGLYCDSNSFSSYIIKPHHTVSFQFPKLAFLLPQNHQYTGQFHVVDIDLSPKKIEETKTSYFYLERDMVKKMYKPRDKYEHKGNYGHLQVFAGSYGKIGAAILALKAAMKTGVGLLTAFVPKCGYQIIQSTVPEAMCITDRNERIISKIEIAETATHFALGPGIGKREATLHALRELFDKARKPFVIDADAINLVAENPELLNAIPKNSILTPHPKEFERLAGDTDDDFERIDRLQKFCNNYQLICLIKGAHTVICLPNGEVYFNSTGNPGMATAGSGDVLTGMIGSLLAQGYSPKKSALLGVYLHGQAGDFAARKVGLEALTATDIISNIGNAFQVVN